MTLMPFSRTAPTDPQADPAREARPETWTPEGVTVSQRFLGLAGAIALVYTADAGVNGAYYAVTCLGCWFSIKSKGGPYNYFASPREAGVVANEHAAQCRALNGPLPERPDDATARKFIRRILDRQRRSEDVTVSLNEFHLDRLALQRSTAWIEDELQRLAAEQPDFLAAKPRSYGPGTEFTIVRFKADAVHTAGR
ncbi:hypothetical protein ABZ851_30145 [Streptomyces sp. NPDC047049]|uniref:hypothetical protein n=1 Tax=Streptomyces sp. NPDC047049 TaxID=3156688 RepID=UPI0034049583